MNTDGHGFRALLCAGLLSALVPGLLRAESFNFRTGILPILSKAGCNTGACHGAATGQAGFKLSLLGYDPEHDHASLTRELGGRRLDLDTPAESLLLKKASRQLEHEGGRRLPRGSTNYHLLLEWIKAGAPYGSPELMVANIEVEPAVLYSTQLPSEYQLRVEATYSDGARKDVTALALYTSNDDSLAAVSPHGVVSVQRSGITSIMIRFAGQVAAARVVSPFPGEPPSAGQPLPEHFIDRHIFSELKRLNVPASPLSSDAEFLRRVCLDVAGRLPSVEEARAFLGQLSGAGKRAELIDKLLASDEFVDFWTLKFADLLLISGKRGAEKATEVYHTWLREQMARNTPWNEIARALLTATGNVSEAGPANYFSLAADPRDLAEHTSRIFLGAQIGCARCHAHPADRWTQDDYYQFAAFFARAGFDGSELKVKDRGEVDHPKSGKPVAPKPLAATHFLPSTPDRRLALADWMTAPDNPLFAKAFVNRVWKHLLGRGLVEPVDDLRPTNPSSHPALFDELAQSFVRHNHDLRWLIRAIATSRAYQLTSKSLPGNTGDEWLFSHARLKPLSAHVLLDAICQVTEVPEHFAGYPLGARSTQLVGAQTPSYALDVLGRCSRERPCEVPAQAGGGLAQALHLINGATIETKLRAPGVVAKLLSASFSHSELLNELYLRTFARSPSDSELSFWLPFLESAENKEEILQDCLWTLLNSREFAFNH